MEPFTSYAPTRVCLFGEHQDYLGLPVIAVALPLFCTIRVVPTTDNIFKLRYNGTTQTYDLDCLERSDPKLPDFCLAVLYETRAAGWEYHGATCESAVNMPVQAGCSTSSSFCVSLVLVLTELSGNSLSPLEVAQMAHRAEVLHFDAPGGTMDHVICSLGGVLRIGPGPWETRSLDMVGTLVVAYSGEPKDTLKHLHRCKAARLKLFEKLGQDWGNEAVDITDDERQLLQTTRINRECEAKANSKWENPVFLGNLMNKHHAALRDGLGLSTNALERLRQAALNHGAYGFKVVGSGGGGCGVAWTDQMSAPAVRDAMIEAGAPRAWIVNDHARGAYVVRD